MKILVFMTQFCQLSGAERLAVELAEELNRRSIHADILSMYSEEFPGAREARRALLDRRIPAVDFLDMPLRPGFFQMVPAVRRLRRLLRDRRYDIVETSMLGPTTLACWATRGTPTRLVAGIHDTFMKERCNRPKHRFWRFSVRANPRAQFYAISQSAASCWIRYSGTSPDRTTVLYNGIADDFFEARPARREVREELGIPAEDRIALFVGRLLKRKGIDTILEAIEPFLREGSLHLLYVGEEYSEDGFFAKETGLAQRLQQRLTEETWGRRVRFLGRREDVARLMAASDVLVHPARVEGFGLVLAEALACRLPIVASNIEGIPEVLADTDSLLVPPNRPDLVREAVVQILQRSPQEQTAAAARGRARVEHFRMGHRVDNLVQLFNDVIRGKQRAA